MIRCFREFLFVCFLFWFSGGFCSGFRASAEEFDYKLTVNLTSYYGVYSGEVNKGLPEGYGVFETYPNEDKQFYYEGEFEDGYPTGQGMVRYEDGTYLEGKYKKGNPNGTMKLWNTNGTYWKIKYKTGVPCGVATLYSEYDQYITCDFYYNGERISELKKIAAEVPYAELFEEENEQYGEIVVIEGVVNSIVEEQASCYLSVETKEGNVYWVTYLNGEFNEYKQAIVPDLHVDESVKLYGFYHGIQSKYLNGGMVRYPQIDSFTCETEDITMIDRGNLEFVYGSICRYPYIYYQLRNGMKGMIKRIIRKSETEGYLQFVSDNEHVYYVKYKISDDMEYIPIPGDYVFVGFTYAGIYKEWDTENNKCLGHYPLLNAKKIEPR